jgi:hypothetical protein
MKKKFLRPSLLLGSLCIMSAAALVPGCNDGGPVVPGPTRTATPLPTATSAANRFVGEYQGTVSNDAGATPRPGGYINEDGSPSNPFRVSIQSNGRLIIRNNAREEVLSQGTIDLSTGQARWTLTTPSGDTATYVGTFRGSGALNTTHGVGTVTVTSPGGAMQKVSPWAAFKSSFTP